MSWKTRNATLKTNFECDLEFNFLHCYARKFDFFSLSVETKFNLFNSQFGWHVLRLHRLLLELCYKCSFSLSFYFYGFISHNLTPKCDHWSFKCDLIIIFSSQLVLGLIHQIATRWRGSIMLFLFHVWQINTKYQYLILTKFHKDWVKIVDFTKKSLFLGQ